jgi:hypothetical protein
VHDIETAKRSVAAALTWPQDFSCVLLEQPLFFLLQFIGFADSPSLFHRLNWCSVSFYSKIRQYIPAVLPPPMPRPKTIGPSRFSTRRSAAVDSAEAAASSLTGSKRARRRRQQRKKEKERERGRDLRACAAGTSEI